MNKLSKKKFTIYSKFLKKKIFNFFSLLTVSGLKLRAFFTTSPYFLAKVLHVRIFIEKAVKFTTEFLADFSKSKLKFLSFEGIVHVNDPK